MTTTHEADFDKALLDVTRWHLEHGILPRVTDASRVAEDVARKRRRVAEEAVSGRRHYGACEHDLLRKVDPEPPVEGEHFDVRDSDGFTWRIFTGQDGDLPMAQQRGIQCELWPLMCEPE